MAGDRPDEMARHYGVEQTVVRRLEMDRALEELQQELTTLLSWIASRDSSTLNAAERNVTRARIWSLEKRIAALRAAAEKPDKD